MIATLEIVLPNHTWNIIISSKPYFVIIKTEINQCLVSHTHLYIYIYIYIYSWTVWFEGNRLVLSIHPIRFQFNHFSVQFTEPNRTKIMIDRSNPIFKTMLQMVLLYYVRLQTKFTSNKSNHRANYGRVELVTHLNRYFKKFSF